MKKKFKFLLLLCLLSVQMVNAKPEYLKETRLSISNQTGVSLEVLYSANNEFLDEYNVSKNDLFDIDSLQISLSEKGYTVQDSFIQNGVALGIDKTFGALDSVSSLKAVKVDLTDIAKDTFDDKAFFQKKIGFLKTTYVGNFVFDYTTIKKTDVDLNQIATVRFYLYTPKVCKSHNATEEIEENILAWDIKLGQSNEVNFEFQETNTIVVLMLVIVAIVLLIILIVLMVRKLSHKRIEYQETKGKEKKKNKKQKVKKEKQKNIHNNGMTFDEPTKNNNPSNEFVVTNKQEPVNNVQTNNQMQQPVQNQPIQNNQMYQQPMNNQMYQQMQNQPVNNQMYQQPMNQNNNIFNQQPVNRPMDNNNNNLYSSEPKDFTDVFNFNFNDDNKNNQM